LQRKDSSRDALDSAYDESIRDSAAAWRQRVIARGLSGEIEVSALSAAGVVIKSATAYYRPRLLDSSLISVRVENLSADEVALVRRVVAGWRYDR
jgi:hypothetical protein